MKNIGEPCGVFGQVFEFYRTVFHKGNRFPVIAHGHHNIEARFSHLEDRALKCRIGRLYHAASFFFRVVKCEAQVRHHFSQPF